MDYAPLCRRFRRARPFRLNSGRRLWGLLGRWLYYTSKAVDCRGGGCSIRRISSGGRSSSPVRPCNRSSSRKGLLREQGSRRQECKPPETSSCPGSNTFYADAIADCLEFIRRTSISVDEAAMARG